MSPFFSNLFDFLQEKTGENCGFEVGGIAIKRRGKYTLGNLPPLLSWQWEALKREALEQTNKPIEERMYQTVFFGNKIGQSDRQLIEKFLTQWKHPLSKWLQQKDKAASAIEQIRQLRNRASHHEGILYLWQFKKLWSLTIGGKTKKGILREIYD